MNISDEAVRQRGSVLGIQVISQSTGKRLGTVTEIWVDMNQRQVMGLTVAERSLPGTAIGFGDTFYMAVENIELLGPDAILVENERVLEDILVSERYSNLIGCEVVTESGEVLGKVRDFQFDPANGDLLYLVLSSLGLPQIPSQLVSTYLLDVNEVIAVGRERIVVTEGMEERMEQLSKGILETLGLGKPPWEQEFEEEYMPPTSISGNALGSGQRSAYNYPAARSERPISRREQTWEDDDENWAEERMPAAPPSRKRRSLEPEPPARSRRPEVREEREEDEYYENTQQQIQSAWSDEIKISEKARRKEELEEL